jgi:hypothetical protein
MNTHTHFPRPLRGLTLALALGAGLFLAGCAGSGDDPSNGSSVISLDLNLPDSLTGGTLAAAATGVSIGKAAASGSEPCAFLGNGDDDDSFRNGYNMTRFMVSAVATWSCVTDNLIEIAATVPHDGQIHETDNDTQAVDYKADDPTHYSVSDDSASQITARLYYAYDRVTPPTADDDAGFYVSWNTADNGDITGRLVIDLSKMNPTDHKADDPVKMRMDFTYTTFTKVADMYLQFDDGNPWADGLRIQVSKDLAANPLQQVFTARGLMAMKAQFLPVSGIDELPQLRMYTVSDSLGKGAAIAEYVDVALGLEIDATTGDNLGNYLFNKTDRYFFRADQDWDWIDKTITSSAYRGGRNIVSAQYSLDNIEAYLSLDPTYFDSNCLNVGDQCNELLNAIVADGFAGQEQNQGTDPMDWRSTAVASPDYLTTVYPNGSDWTGAFEPVFTP